MKGLVYIFTFLFLASSISTVGVHPPALPSICATAIPDNTRCLTCKEGYTLKKGVNAFIVDVCTNESAPAITNCAASDGSNCVLCNKGYTLDGTTCTKCASSCDYCTDSAIGSCKVCSTTYFLVTTPSNSCSKCSIACDKCESATKCVGCTSGFELTNGACSLKINIDQGIIDTMKNWVGGSLVVLILIILCCLCTPIIVVVCCCFGFMSCLFGNKKEVVYTNQGYNQDSGVF